MSFSLFFLWSENILHNHDSSFNLISIYIFVRRWLKIGICDNLVSDVFPFLLSLVFPPFWLQIHKDIEWKIVPVLRSRYFGSPCAMHRQCVKWMWQWISALELNATLIVHYSLLLTYHQRNWSLYLLIQSDC